MLKKLKKLSERITANALSFSLLGKTLIAISLGAIFSRQLVQYSYYLLLIISILLIYYLNASWIQWKKNARITFTTLIWGSLSIGLLAFLIGIQSPQLPAKEYVLAIGILSLLPALRSMFHKKKLNNKKKD